jgi:hypothetical protein
MSCEHLNYKEFTKKNEIYNYFNYIKDKKCCNVKDCKKLGVEKVRLKFDCEENVKDKELCEEINKNIQPTREMIKHYSQNTNETIFGIGGKKSKRKTKRRNLKKRKTRKR